MRNLFTAAVLSLALGCSGEVAGDSSNDDASRSRLSGDSNDSPSNASSEAEPYNKGDGEAPCTDVEKEDDGRPTKNDHGKPHYPGKPGKPGKPGNGKPGKPPPPDAPAPGSRPPPVVCTHDEAGGGWACKELDPNEEPTKPK